MGGSGRACVTACRVRHVPCVGQAVSFAVYVGRRRRIGSIYEMKGHTTMIGFYAKLNPWPPLHSL